MTRRIRYAGDPVASASGAYPVQPETRAYIARMSVSPSLAWRTAINTAIYKWKKLGVWSSIIQLVIMAADTQQAALLDVTANARNATVTGTPTFAANKGFTGFSSSNGLNFGLTSTMLVDDNFTSVFAGITLGNISSGEIIRSDPTTSLNTPGTIYTDSAGNVVAGTTGIPITNSAVWPVRLTVGGARDTQAVTTLTVATANGANTGALSGYKTALVSSPALVRLLAYGALGSSVSLLNARKFFVILQELLEAVSAFD